jgi:hypothetical protein
LFSRKKCKFKAIANLLSKLGWKFRKQPVYMLVGAKEEEEEEN